MKAREGIAVIKEDSNSILVLEAKDFCEIRPHGASIPHSFMAGSNTDVLSYWLLEPKQCVKGVAAFTVFKKGGRSTQSISGIFLVEWREKEEPYIKLEEIFVSARYPLVQVFPAGITLEHQGIIYCTEGAYQGKSKAIEVSGNDLCRLIADVITWEAFELLAVKQGKLLNFQQREGQKKDDEESSPSEKK